MLKKGFVIGAVFMFAASSVLAYEGGPVSNGGTIKGTVKVSGTIPQDEMIGVTKDQAVCGEKLPRQKYVISSDGGIKNVVVSIKNISKGKAIPDEPVVIDNKKCAFHPHVQVGIKGQKMFVQNDDPMLHNTHMYLDKKTMFNAALPFQGAKIPKTIKKTGLVSIECDVHSWMKGYLMISENPYITVTDDKGGFTISDIPPGTYEVEFWHETFGTQLQQITVEANGEASLEIEYKQ